MSVAVRPYRKGSGGWHVDVRVRLADGSRYRDRKRFATTSKSAALRWGQERERHLLQHGPPQLKKEVPTLEAFAPRFVDGYARANRQKPSGIAAKETILRVHLIPRLGAKTLDRIANEAVQGLKLTLGKKSPKTVNNVLTVLNKLLRTAVEWGVLDQMPCAIRLLPIPPSRSRFHDFDEFDRLVEASAKLDWRAHLIVLLGGEAGLRCGEIMALRWEDVNLHDRHLTVVHSDWKGHVTSTKGGRMRVVPLTTRLASALQAHRHLRSERVVCRDDGTPLTQKIVQDFVRHAARRADVRDGVHILRHTFCSHLAMLNVPARTIQEYAGHQDLSTTNGYMHLSSAAKENAIRVLDGPRPVLSRGNSGATGTTEMAKSSR